MRRNPVLEKSYALSLEVVRVYRAMVERREFVLSKQLVRAGTSIGANVEEALAAQSRRDFIAKMSIARKEARECNYWIRLLRDSDMMTDAEAERLLAGSVEMIRLLTAIIISTEQNPGPQ
jgi:four helix bundle protein